MARLLMMVPAMLAMYLPFCAAEVRPILAPPAAPPASLWQEPTDLADRDVFYGPWGPERAPDPSDRYTLVERKHSGVNPGLTVRDRLGREWSVKQVSPDALAAEGPIEVVLSRVLSAVGYHQPPIYYLPEFTFVDDWGAHTEPGGRFRLKEKTLKDRGEWSWQQNPFVGTRPYQGLLVDPAACSTAPISRTPTTRSTNTAGATASSTGTWCATSGPRWAAPAAGAETRRCGRLRAS